MGALGVAALGTEPLGGYPFLFVPPSGPPSFPRLIVEIAFASAPMSTSPSWVDVSASVRRMTTHRGRSSELDRFSAGTAGLSLDNRDRVFDPHNTAGPFYGLLLPNRLIRIRAESLGVTYPLFYGFVDDWEQAYQIAGDQTCALSATDGFKRLAQILLPPKESSVGVPNPAAFTRPQESAGARVNALLDYAKVAWPAAMRTVDAGMAICAAKTYDGGSVLDALYAVDATEQGRMFIGADGNFVFRDRQSMVVDASFTTPQAYFSDDHAGTTIPYASIGFEHSDRLIRNDVVVTNETYGAYTAADSASQTAYGTSSYQLTTLDASPQASRSTAENLLAAYKDARSRVTAINVKPKRSTAGWPDGLFPAVLPLELGNRVNAVKQPLGGGPAVDEDYWVEEVTHTFQPGWWETSYRPGLARDAADFLRWDVGKWDVDKWGW